MESERLLCWEDSKRCQSCQDQSEIAKWGERSDRHRDRIQHFVVHLTASKAKAVGPEYQLSISWLFKAVFEYSRVFNFIELNRNSKLRLFSVKLSCKQKIDEKNKAKYLLHFPIIFHFWLHFVKIFPFFRDFLVEKTIAGMISTFLLNCYEKLEKLSPNWVPISIRFHNVFSQFSFAQN